MRRGRPPAGSQPAPQPARPNASPAKVTNGDPFAALDSKFAVQSGDELSSRFPTLDEFSILHDHGTKFEFDSSLAEAPQQQPKDLSQRLSERLADEAFQSNRPPSPVRTPANHTQPVDASRAGAFPGAPASSEMQRVSPPLKSAPALPKPTEMSRASAIISSTPELKAISSQASQPLYQPPPDRPAMVSTGTMTTPPPEGQTTAAPYQIYRFPSGERHRASSLPRQQDAGAALPIRTEAGSSSRPAMGSRTSSLQATHIRPSSSSRPSLEGGRPGLEILDPANKTKPQATSRPRPVSTHLESNLDYLREKEANPMPLGSPGHISPRYSLDKDLPPPPSAEDETNIESNVEFLRSMEESDPKKRDGRSKHSKRASLTSFGAGTKNILVGKFGDAFKRFEGGTAPPPRTPSPLKDLERRDLTPIAGSEATDGRSDDGQLRDHEDMTPEMRREQEAQMLAQEEARVAAAQAEYRQRVASRGPSGPGGAGPTPPPKSIGGVSRAVSIQNKVQSLLDETARSSSNVVRTAQGYGAYTDAAGPRPSGGDGRPAVPRKPLGGASGGQPNSAARSNTLEPSSTGRTVASSVGGRPAAPPKPIHLNKNLASGGNLPVGGRPASPPKPLMPSSSVGLAKPRDATATTTASTLVALELPGQPSLTMTATEKDDYLRDFQKRFPSLTAIEMVERDLAAEAEAGVDAGKRPV